MVCRRSDRADADRRAVVDVLAAVADRCALGREARLVLGHLGARQHEQVVAAAPDAPRALDERGGRPHATRDCFTASAWGQSFEKVWQPTTRESLAAV